MKKLTDYQAVIVDLDGTLYYQKPVRIAMLKEMLLRFWRVREFLVVKKYRDLFEQGLNEKERLSRLPSYASVVIQEWMVDRPCPYVAKYKDSELIGLLEGAKAVSVMVIVYSDYPVKEKLRALRFFPDAAYRSEDIGHLKPEAEGLKRILEKQGISPDHCLVIGDRDEKDGALARNLGSEKLILPSSVSDRKTVLETMRL